MMQEGAGELGNLSEVRTSKSKWSILYLITYFLYYEKEGSAV